MGMEAADKVNKSRGGGLRKGRLGNTSRHRDTMKRRNSLWGYFFISPFIVGCVFLFAIPLALSLIYSFNTLKVTGSGYELVFAGLDNYKEIFLVDTEFRKNLVSSLSQMVLQVPIIVIFSFFAAVLLNAKFRGRTIARSVFFLPVILTSGVIISLETSDVLLNSMQQVASGGGSSWTSGDSAGLFDVAELLQVTGIAPEAVSFLMQAVDGIYDITVASGVQIIIFLAGLQSISPSVYEAASVEGATGWEAFWKITFPMINSLILVNTIYSIIDYSIKSTNVVMQQIQWTSVRTVEYGLGAAMAWAYFVPVLVILGVVGALISRKTFYYD